MQDGLPQEVTIVSFPSEATVYIDGASWGTTPMTLALPRKVNHEVRLEKPGYHTAVKYFTPARKKEATNFIRFGLQEDLGHFMHLEPSKMQVRMKSELVPVSTGRDPFETMAIQTLEADARLEAGEITPIEHKYIIEQIVAFFESQ